MDSPSSHSEKAKANIVFQGYETRCIDYSTVFPRNHLLQGRDTMCKEDYDTDPEKSYSALLQ